MDTLLAHARASIWCSHLPVHRRPYLFQTTTTAELATELLDELSGMMEPQVFASAVSRGEVKGLDILVKELLTEDRTHPTATI